MGKKVQQSPASQQDPASQNPPQPAGITLPASLEDIVQGDEKRGECIFFQELA